MAGNSNDDDANTTGVALPLPVETLPRVGRRSGFLIVVGGDSAELTGRIFKVDQAEMIIGRLRNAHIRLHDEGVSRQHAKLVGIPGGQYRIVDLGSKNGTHVNGARVTEADLQDGDRIQIGSTAVLLFSLQDELEERFTQRLYESATHDGLTRLFNRTFFQNALEKEISFSHRYRSPFSLMLIDIDHFKRVNDTHGHPGGDHVLTSVSNRLAQLIRNEDVLARIGGEEFGVILRQADLRSAQICGERCRSAIEGLALTFNRVKIPLTISLGICTLMGAELPVAADVVAQADARLYEAKTRGRNRVIAGQFIPTFTEPPLGSGPTR